LKRLMVCGAVTLLTCGACPAQSQSGSQQAGLPQQQSQQPQPEFIEKGRRLTREGKLEEALAVYRQELQGAPDSVQAHVAAGVALDLMGRGAEGRQHFTSAINAARTPQEKAGAQRRMAISYAFEGDCAGAVRFAQQVFDYHVAEKNFFQQGEIANEVARVCLESGDLNAAEKWYRTGHEVGLREPDIKPERVALWNFRWAHAQARLAARRGRKDEARKHVAAAKALLDQSPELAKDQAIFFPYLTGYVAFHGGDYQTALTELLKANQDDAFIQTLIGQSYEKLGQAEKATEYYRKAAQVTSHNPPAAYARPFARKKLGMK
jgi:tetratricopeptide (TPR) repeat protein